MCLHCCCACRVQNHQIELLKDEVTAKDAALVKEHFGHVRAEQECDTLRTESDQVSLASHWLLAVTGLRRPWP